MSDIHQLVWNGGLNTQIEIDKSLVFMDDESKPLFINVRLPRESYFVLYASSLLHRIKLKLRKDIDEVLPYIWFEQDGSNLPWNIPIGTLHDIMNQRISELPIEAAASSTSILVWKIRMVYGQELPQNHIPLTNGLEQVQKYWMHQWKQACFVLNGTSKQIMSMKMDDSKAFWQSVISRNVDIFSSMSDKIVPSIPRNIPVMVHRQNYMDFISQPLVIPQKESWKTTTLQTVLDSSEYTTTEQNTLAVVCQGIDVPCSILIEELYRDFVSLDGFLHLILQQQ